MRKDFILEKSEVERTSEAEASAILLISGLLGEKTAEYVDFSLEHGLDTLVEVHSIEDVRIANETNTTMIGINNRNISKLEVDDGSVEITERLAGFVKEGVIKVSESGIRTIEDLKRALKCVDAVLIGTVFMQSGNLEKTVKSFVEAI